MLIPVSYDVLITNNTIEDRIDVRLSEDSYTTRVTRYRVFHTALEEEGTDHSQYSVMLAIEMSKILFVQYRCEFCGLPSFSVRFALNQLCVPFVGRHHGPNK